MRDRAHAPADTRPSRSGEDGEPHDAPDEAEPLTAVEQAAVDDEELVQSEQILRSSFPFTPLAILFCLVCWYSGASLTARGTILGFTTLFAWLLVGAGWHHNAVRSAGREWPQFALVRRFLMAALVASWSSMPILSQPGDRSVVVCFQLVSALTPVAILPLALRSRADITTVLVTSVLCGELAMILAPAPWRIAPAVVLPLSAIFTRSSLEPAAVRRRGRTLLRLRTASAAAELSEGNARLAELATRDALTGLGNRQKMLPRLHEMVAESAVSGKRIAVLFVDVDRFKVVNDSLGHAAGDQLLKVIADRTQAIIDSSMLLSRLGGDEFTLVLREATAESALAMAERLRSTVAQPVALESRTLVVTISIGVALSVDGDRPEDLLRHADAALYKAKENGRNRAELFDEAMRQQLIERFDEEQALRQAIEGDGVVPWYQPEVDLASGETVGAEALARYHHPTRGTLEAIDFLSIADEVGLFEALSDTILNKVVAQRGEWARAGIPDDVRVRIHVSPDQIARRDFASHFQEIIERYGCPARSLVLEVTETDLVADPAQLRQQMEEIRRIGSSIVLDDFGSGHSSLALLLALDLDGLKLDQTLVRHCRNETRGKPLLEALIGLGQMLDLEVCADGVESAEEAETLQELGCSTAQGYLWSPPLDPDKMLALLESTEPRAVNRGARP